MPIVLTGATSLFGSKIWVSGLNFEAIFVGVGKE